MITVPDGALLIQSPSDVKAYTFDWDVSYLAEGVLILASSWTVTPLRPAAVPDTGLTADQVTVFVGQRKTQVRLSSPTLGQLYRLTNSITTNEHPPQTKERSIKILAQVR